MPTENQEWTYLIFLWMILASDLGQCVFFLFFFYLFCCFCIHIRKHRIIVFSQPITENTENLYNTFRKNYLSGTIIYKRENTMSTLPQIIAFIFLLAAFVCSGFIDVDNRKFWWAIGFAVLAGLIFALDISSTPIKWHPAVGIPLAILLPVIFLLIGARMSFQQRKANEDRIEIVRLSYRIREQMYKDIFGKVDYEKYIASEKCGQ